MSDSFATPWTVACQAPLSMEFPRQEYWSGLPFPPPGHLPRLRDWTRVFYVSCIGKWILYHWAIWEAPFSIYSYYKILTTFPVLYNIYPYSLSIFADGNISFFLWLNSIPFVYTHMHHTTPQLLCSFIDGHLYCFCILAVLMLLLSTLGYLYLF